MADYTSSLWDYYVAIISVASILACAVLLKVTSRRRTGEVSTQTTGHVWDEDLGEYNNPLPRWWMGLFYLTIVFSLGYLVLYPGLGSYSGTLGWSSVAQHRDEVERAQAQSAPLYQRFAAKDIMQLAGDPEARAVGQKLFLNNCAQCHSADAAGSRGFPNLTDRDWLYGGDAQAIEASILNGRSGAMPPFGATLGDDGVKNVAHYVLALAGRTHDSIRAARGQETFKTTCFACHGADGKGNPALGAPNLTDGVWLHGSSEAAIIETIAKGRTSAMPAHKELLGEARVRLLAAYVYGLSHGANESAAAGTSQASASQ
jgi:cytochrome c oxidase cbb3-type subunit 3